MKPHRKEVLKKLFQKLKTHDTVKVCSILRHIFEGMGTGEWGKKDLSDMLLEENFDEIILECIGSVEIGKNKESNISLFMDLLLGIYRLCSSFKIKIDSIKKIYECVSNSP